MKCQLFTGKDEDILQKSINAFIKGKAVEQISQSESFVYDSDIDRTFWSLTISVWYLEEFELKSIAKGLT